MRFGFQVKVDKGFEKALNYAIDLGCETLQMLISSPLSWSISKTLEGLKWFVQELKYNDIYPIAIHTPYLLNLSSTEEEIYRKSVLILGEHLRYAEEAGADFVIVHAGSHKGAGWEVGIVRLTSALGRISEKHKGKAMILVENTAGGGGGMCATLEEIEMLLKELDRDKIGICLDVCHLFSAGYDLRTEEKVKELSAEAENKLGKSLKMLHLNDCKSALGSKVDRHESLGKGSIGLRGIKAIIKNSYFQNLPAIMETPYDPVEDRYNIYLAKKLRDEE